MQTSDATGAAPPTIAETVAKLGTDDKRGLTDAEVQERLKKYGPNALVEKQKNAFAALLAYFWGAIPWIIEAAALMAFIVGDWGDFTIITSLLLFNALLGFWEEHEASNALDALKSSLALKARALRDERLRAVPNRHDHCHHGVCSNGFDLLSLFSAHRDHANRAGTSGRRADHDHRLRQRHGAVTAGQVGIGPGTSDFVSAWVTRCDSKLRSALSGRHGSSPTASAVTNDDVPATRCWRSSHVICDANKRRLLETALSQFTPFLRHRRDANGSSVHMQRRLACTAIVLGNHRLRAGL